MNSGHDRRGRFPVSSRMHSRRFTLVELITVMIIMLIIAGLGAVAFRGVRESKGVTGGAQRMARMLAMGRQLAVSESMRVALLLPDLSLSNSEFKPGDNPGVVMRLCEVNYKSEWQRWLPGQDWVQMPERTYFSTSTSTVTGVDWTRYEEMPYVIKSDPTVSTPGGFAVVFNPNGTLMESSGVTIDIRPFSIESASYSTGPNGGYRLTVPRLTGIPAIAKLEKIGR